MIVIGMEILTVNRLVAIEMIFYGDLVAGKREFHT